MTMTMFARLMEASLEKRPTQQISLVSKEAEKFSNEPLLFSLIALEYSNNNIGLAKAKKWLAKAFDIFDDEVDSFYTAMKDLGDVVYFLDPGAKTTQPLTLGNLLTLLQLDCQGANSTSFETIQEALLAMSALERKWFVRYWLKIPRNGMNEGSAKKMLAKKYDRTLADVKHHCNFNTIRDTASYYEMGEEPTISLEYGQFLAPMLATSLPKKQWPKDKIVDYKYDGNRYQIHKDGEAVLIFNRKGKPVTQQFSDVADIVRGYDCQTCILDGEIYPVEVGGSPAPHSRLGTRVHSKDHASAIERCPVDWVMFDCLMLNGENLTALPYSERLDKMANFPNQANRSKGDVIAFYNRAINEGFEGIIIKDVNSPYESGKRSKFWVKYKPPRISLDVVILSAKKGEGEKSNVFASLDIGVKSENGFASIGSVGTGLSNAQSLLLTNQLRTLVESYKDGKYFFLPRVVLEVTADLVTRDSKGTISLRFPRVVRIREDKYVADINTFTDAIQMMNGM